MILKGEMLQHKVQAQGDVLWKMSLKLYPYKQPPSFLLTCRTGCDLYQKNSLKCLPTI